MRAGSSVEEFRVWGFGKKSVKDELYLIYALNPIIPPASYNAISRSLLRPAASAAPKHT